MSHHPFFKFMTYLSFLGVLFFHFIWGQRYSEPYPSLIFPSFSKVPEQTDTLTICTKEIFATTNTQDTILLDKESLFELLPPHFHQYALMTLVFKEYKQNPGKEFLDQKKEFIKYISSKLNKAYPEQTFNCLFIKESEKFFAINNASFVEKEKITRKTAIPLR